MKERRSFVVKFKSSRRQAKPQSSSIWGDTDLKAIRREVENQSRHFSEHSEPPVGTCGPDDALQTSDNALIQTDHAEGEKVLQEIGPVPTEVLEGPPPSEPNALDASMQVDGTGQPKVRRTAQRRRASPQKRPSVEPAVPSSDELAELAEENQRLRALWRSKLQEENAQLRDMIDRMTL